MYIFPIKREETKTHSLAKTVDEVMAFILSVISLLTDHSLLNLNFGALQKMNVLSSSSAHSFTQ